MSQIDPLMTVRRFRQFLVEVDGNPAGRAGSDVACPLATYLRHNGVVDPSVGHASILHPAYGWHRHSYRLPDWARRFVHRIDASSRGGVTGDQATLILDEVTRRRPAMKEKNL